MKHQFFIPTQINFGAGCLEQLGELKLPGKKALIVITPDAWIVENGHLDRIVRLLQKAGKDSAVYNKVHPNPGKKQVEEGTKFCLEQHCDMVLGFGGGSSIDTAKSIALLAANGGDFWDYVSVGSGKGKPVAVKPLPVIAVPTTAGTGTEADPWVVVTKEETNEKIGFGAPELFPTVSFVDAELMVSVPAKLTAFQGFDALFHAMEGYIANVATPISDIFALKSITLLGKNLVDAVQNGRNIAAREAVALASTCSGIVESISNCTSNHSIAQAMGAYHDNLPHGAALLMIANEYFKSFTDVIPQRYAEMACALTGRTDASPKDLLDKLYEMEKACGVEALKMTDYGICHEELEVFCTNALENAMDLFEIEPRPLTRARVMEILEKSYR